MMSQPRFDLITSIASQCTLAEGPVWDTRTGALWFTDIQNSELLLYHWGSGTLRRFALPERLGSIGLTSDPGKLICAFASGFAKFRPATGECQWLHRIEPEYRGLRMNDGRMDRFGRFWAGSMVENEAQAPPERGSLYLLDRSDGLAAEKMLEGISISNSICFSPDGRFLYFADTPTQEIVRYTCPPDKGALSGRVSFARLNARAYPDGSDVDAAGRVWNAEWGSGRVTAYEPDGSIFAQIDLPVSQASCVAFGGPALDLLFVTTAREGLSADRLTREPHAGDVLVYQTGVKGLAAPVFQCRASQFHDDPDGPNAF